MTLSAILADFYRRMRYTATPPTAIATRATAFANKVQSDILTTPGLTKLRDEVMPVSLTANTARQGLPPLVGRIHGITDRTNNFKLQQVPLSQLRIEDPSQANTGGYAMRYAVVGNQEVAIQPTTTGSGLWVASSVAETNAVYVEAARLGGFPFYDNTATVLAGTTRVSVKSAPAGTGVQTDYILVDRFYMSTAATGYVSLYDAATAGNELGRIPIGNTFSRYLCIELWPIPTQTNVVYVDFSRVIPDLVNAFDEPLLPDDFHDIMVQGMQIEEYEFLDDTRVLLARQKYQKTLTDMVNWILDDPDRIASLRPTARQWSRLGSAFPADNQSFGGW
jgi:hypothetical protein